MKMSDYTVTLKRCCDVYGRDKVESWFKQANIYDYLPFNKAHYVTMFMQDNNIDFMRNLGKAIVDHYYFREIAYETPEMFSYMAKAKMQELMRNLLSTSLHFMYWLRTFWKPYI